MNEITEQSIQHPLLPSVLDRLCCINITAYINATISTHTTHKPHTAIYNLLRFTHLDISLGYQLRVLYTFPQELIGG